MLNPQELYNKTFEKAVFGGYDMASVDDFLAQVAEDYSALYKEMTVLKTKMKVLVDKIEEYRSTESAMNKALLAAQRISSEMEDEAREQADAMLRQAEDEAARILHNAQAQVAGEEERLVEAKRASAEFIEKMRLVCTTQLDFLDALGEMKLGLDEVPAAAAEAVAEEPVEEYVPEAVEDHDWDSTVRSIEDSVTQLTEEPELEVEPELEYQEEEAEAEPTRLFNLGDEVAPRPKFNFENLRFGDNYGKK